MMDIDVEQSSLREKLIGLGFTQSLPFGSVAIVSKLLDDLILSKRDLKNARKMIIELEKVR